MPLYFFQVIDSRALVDIDGVDYPDVEAARDAAVRTAGQIVASEGTTYWQGDAWRLVVAEETGKVVFTLDITTKPHD